MRSCNFDFSVGTGYNWLLKETDNSLFRHQLPRPSTRMTSMEGEGQIMVLSFSRSEPTSQSFIRQSLAEIALIASRSLLDRRQLSNDGFFLPEL